MGTQKVISIGLNRWAKRYNQKQLEAALEDVKVRPERYGLGLVDDVGREVKNVWDGIVVQGKKGIAEALSSKYKTIDGFLNSSEYASKVSTDFTKYQARGGSLESKEVHCKT